MSEYDGNNQQVFDARRTMIPLYFAIFELSKLSQGSNIPFIKCFSHSFVKHVGPQSSFILDDQLRKTSIALNDLLHLVPSCFEGRSKVLSTCSV